MAWFHEQHPQREGFVVALVHPDERPGAPGVYRELSYPADDQIRNDVVVIAAGCSCGWRSPYLVPQATILPGALSEAPIPVPSYSPFTAWVTEPDEAECRRLWTTHIGATIPGRAEVLTRH